MGSGKALLALGAVVLIATGMSLAIAMIAANKDDASVPQAQGPGVPRPAGEKPTVAPGNVLLLYSDERLTRSVRELAHDTAGEPDPALAAAGQAVLVLRRPNQRVAVVALSATHRLQAAAPGEPTLRHFIEYWLGRAP